MNAPNLTQRPPRSPRAKWWRSHGNENWEFDEHRYMAKRYASINDQPITEANASSVGS